MYKTTHTIVKLLKNGKFGIKANQAKWYFYTYDTEKQASTVADKIEESWSKRTIDVNFAYTEKSITSRL